MKKHIVKATVYTISAIIALFAPLFTMAFYGNIFVSTLMLIFMLANAFFYYRADTEKKNWNVIKFNVVWFMYLYSIHIQKNMGDEFMGAVYVLLLSSIVGWYLFFSDDFFEVDKF